MSSHREAPEISKDPVADNTDVYAFVSPDRPSTVTLIANFLPAQSPQGGPNFYEFGDDVLYEIHVSNRGDAKDDVTYQFRFSTTIRNPNTFLYNTGPIQNITDATFNRPQTYSVTRVARGGKPQVLARNLSVPPVNVGPRSTPNYAHFTAQATHALPGGRVVFAGQRSDAFFVDLGSIFDLGTLRPFQNLHLVPSAAMAGVNGLQGLNVHTIAIQVPKTDLTKGGKNPTDVMDPDSVIGVYASASRQRSTVWDDAQGRMTGHGPWQQVSRLGNPLFNEVIVPMARKDRWNALGPSKDSQFAQYAAQPELAKLLPFLYPGVFPKLAAYTKDRADLLAILLTGIPSGVVPGFQNFTGTTQADLLRLNLAVPPNANPNPLGLVAGDAAGFPNGRRVTDDVVTVELRAIAGLTIPLVDPTFTPDAATSAVKDGTSNTNLPLSGTFPYLGDPAGGYQTKPGGAGRMTGRPLTAERAANLAENPHAGQGPVLLDVGGDVGAVVVHLTAAWEGAEVEVSEVGMEIGHGHRHPHSAGHSHDHPQHRHVAVVGRPTARGLAFTAVFPELTTGRYAFRIPGESGGLTVDVRGGEVAEVRWPG